MNGDSGRVSDSRHPHSAFYSIFLKGGVGVISSVIFRPDLGKGSEIKGCVNYTELERRGTEWKSNDLIEQVKKCVCGAEKGRL